MHTKTKQINKLIKKQAYLTNNICKLLKLSYELNNCKTNCKCINYILEYETLLENFVIKKIIFKNRHEKYIYKIKKIINFYYKELKNSEKQLLIFFMNTPPIHTIFHDLLELGIELNNELAL